MNDSEPMSPCISVCLLDERDICQGCYRSAEEIADWFIADTGDKREILARACRRREAARTTHLS